MKGPAREGAAGRGPGERIGPYRIESVAGRGGMGEVYCAFDERLERRVALKRIRADLQATDDRRERLRREAKAAAALEHPSIVRVHDLLEAGGPLGLEDDWIVMEWVDGEALAQRLRHAPLAAEEVLRFGGQVASALAAAHERGILHRDLKVENIVIDTAGRARVLDFGLSKRLGTPDRELSADGAVLGTHRAMSPEQSRGLPVGESSDLFALGVLLYEMLSGESPFRGADAADTLDRVRRHRQAPLEESAGVPAALSALVDRLLAKDPAMRPGSAREVAEKLADELASSTTGEADEPSWLGQSTLAPRSEGSASIATSTAGSTDDPIASTGGSFAAWRPRPLVLVVLPVLVALLAAGAWFGLGGVDPGSTAHRSPAAKSATGEPATPLYIALAEPELRLPEGETPPDLELLAPALRGAVLDGLLALEGLAPMLDDRASAGAGDPRSLARALAADEVLTSRLDCAPPLCRASLSRISAEDGRVLWSEDFDVPSSDRSLLAPAVIGRLAGAYPGYPPRPGPRRRPLDAERYDRLLRLRLAHLGRSRPHKELLGELEALRSEAPAAPEIYLLQAEVAHARYFYSRRAEDLELVMERLAQAHDLAPRDPQALFRLSRVAIEAGRLDEARRAIEALAELAPGDARVELRRALLLEREGAVERASALLRRSVERHPSWRALFELASLCYRQGELECSRRRLGELLERMPENASARSFLAQLELTSGEPRRAEELYLHIVENAPGVAELSNLGLARLLLGRFDDAAASFRRALELEPDEVLTRLNLANAEELRGRVDAARLLYEEVLARTEGSAGDDWQRATARAQALAHLGRARPAVRELQAALLAADGHPQAAFEAAIVYARLGDAVSVAVHAERARALFSRHWFELPFFDDVRGDPDFVDSLD